MQSIEARDSRFGGGGLARTAVVLVSLVLLPLTSMLSYVLFHTLAEVFYAVVAFSVVIMAWTLRSFLDDDFPAFIGVALASAALLHLLHMADFPGVHMISGPQHLDPPTQLWVSARLITAGAFVIAPFVLGRRLRLRLVAAACLALDTVLILTIYLWDVFPVTLTTAGLTRFKVVAEYVVSALFLLAIALLWSKRKRLPRGTFRLLTAALVASIAAELFFTFYRGPHTWPNLVGHLFLGLSAILVYVGVVEDGLARPHELAVRSLREAQSLHRRLEAGLLPSFRLERTDVTLVGQYRPGERHLELGGDFLDVLDLGERGLAVICGDVCGRGPDAAALGAMLRVSWEALVLSGTPPAALVRALEDVIVRERHDGDVFATVCLAWLDLRDDSIELISLGHPVPLSIGHEVRRLELSPAPPLGAVKWQAEPTTRLPLPPDWQVLFYTDGLIEGRAAPGSEERFGEDRLIEALSQPACAVPDDACITQLLWDIERASGEAFDDDLAVVVIGKRAAAEPAPRLAAPAETAATPV